MYNLWTRVREIYYDDKGNKQFIYPDSHYILLFRAPFYYIPIIRGFVKGMYLIKQPKYINKANFAKVKLVTRYSIKSIPQAICSLGILSLLISLEIISFAINSFGYLLAYICSICQDDDC
jgi:hypothetical protein